MRGGLARNPKLQPIDQVALTLMLVLSVLIGLLVWGGDRILFAASDCLRQNSSSR